MEKFSLRYNVKPAVRYSAATMLLVLSGCSLSQYSTNRYDVPCDASATVAEFDSEQSRVAFITRKSETENSVIISVEDNTDGTYDYSAEILGEESEGLLQPIGPVAEDGSADTDYYVAYGEAEWSVDVQPYNNAVVLKGVC